MNHVVLIGRLTRDPELRYIAGTGTPVANFAIAVDREFSGKDGKKETDFIEYVKQKEILFIKDDLKKIHDENNKVDYSKLEVYYKRKLLDYGQIKVIKNSYKSYGKYLGKIRNTVNKLSA